MKTPTAENKHTSIYVYSCYCMHNLHDLSDKTVRFLPPAPEMNEAEIFVMAFVYVSPPHVLHKLSYMKCVTTAVLKLASCTGHCREGREERNP